MMQFLSALVVVAAAILLWVGADPADGPASFWSTSSDLVSAFSGADRTQIWPTAAAGVVVFFAFFHRFGRWANSNDAPHDMPQSTTRFFTTFVNYHAWAALYAFLALFLFLAIVNYPDVAMQFLKVAAAALPAMKDSIDALLTRPETRAAGDNYLEFMGAVLLFVITFLYTPLEARVRRYFQRNALIPKQAQRIETHILNDIFARSVAPADRAAFIEHSIAVIDVHRAHAFELEQGMTDQRFLEPYARVEFLLWRLRRGDFEDAINDAIADHGAALDEIEAGLAPVRATIASFADMIERALKSLPDAAPEQAMPGYPPPGDRLPAASIAILEEAGLPKLARRPLSRKLSVPASKFDDVIRGMRDNLSSLGPGLREFNLLALDSLEKSLRAAREQLDEALKRLVRLSVCIALYAERSPSYDFLRTLGLNPAQARVRFNPAGALSVAVVIILFLATIVGTLVIAQRHGWIAFKVRPEAWLTMGTIFIVVPILRGAFYGAALAGHRVAAAGDHREPDAACDAVRLAWAFLLSGATLVFALFIYVQLLENPGAVFRGAAPFIAVPAIWGAISARATMRALLDHAPVAGPLDVAAAVGAVEVSLVLVWAYKGAPAFGPGTLWFALFLIGPALTLGLFAALRSVAAPNAARRTEPEAAAPLAIAE